MDSASRFDRYEILGPLGVGGMGEVVKARAAGPHGFEKTVAIKRIRPGVAMHPSMAERFVREAQIAARLEHANIVQVFDFGRHDDELFLVMEYVDGQSLDDILASLRTNGKSATLSQVLQVGLDVARALDVAHTLESEDGSFHGVIHRDVSPANVLISQKGVVKLTDFGIAAIASGPDARPSAVAGKPLFMAPEQVRGDPLDPRADLFAVGVVLYEMLTGARPWKGMVDPNPRVTLDDMDYRPPSAHRSDVPEDLDNLVTRLVQPDREARVGSARELIREILEISYRHHIVLDASELVGLLGPRHPIGSLPPPGKRPETLFARGVGADGETILASAPEEESVSSRTATPKRPRTLAIVLAGSVGILIGVGAIVARHARQAPTTAPETIRSTERATTSDPAGASGLAGTELAEATSPSVQEPRTDQGTPARVDTGLVGSETQVDTPSRPDAPVRPPLEAASPEAESHQSGPGASRAGGSDRRSSRRSSPSATPSVDGAAADTSAPAPAVARATGRLDVFSQPWAYIYIDGQRRPETAPAPALTVPAGRHVVRLVNPVLGLSREVSVDVPANGRAAVRVYLDGSE